MTTRTSLRRTSTAFAAALLLLARAAAPARASSMAIVVYNEPNFTSEAAAFARAISQYGYATRLIDGGIAVEGSGDQVFTTIRNYIDGASLIPKTPGEVWRNNCVFCAPMAKGDRLLLDLQCDGGLNVGVYRSLTQHVDADGNYVASAAAGGQTVGDQNACWMSADQVRDLAAAAAAKGLEIVVLDHACSGGAVPELLEPKGICSVAFAPPGDPAITGFPPLSQYLSKTQYPYVTTFSDLARLGEASLFADSSSNSRLQQRGFFTTTSGLAAPSMILRSAVYQLEQSLQNWNLSGTTSEPFIYQWELANFTAGQQAMAVISPGTASSPPMSTLLAEAKHYDTILKSVLLSVQKGWNAAPPTSAQAAMYDDMKTQYTSQPFQYFDSNANWQTPSLAVDGGLALPLIAAADWPATIADARTQAASMIQQLIDEQAILIPQTAALDAAVSARPDLPPAAPGNAVTAILAQIGAAQLADAQILPKLSILLGALEDTEALVDGGACGASIQAPPAKIVNICGGAPQMIPCGSHGCVKIGCCLDGNVNVKDLACAPRQHVPQ